MRIYVIDDEQAIADQLAGLCMAFCRKKKMEAEVISAQSFDACLQRENAGERPDILLLDIEMPGMSGLDIKAYYDQKHWETPELRREGPYIIFVSGHSEWMPKAFGSNVMAFLQKPVDEKSLEAVLETTMRYTRRDDAIPLEDNQQIVIGNILYIRANHIYTDVLTAGGKIVSIRRSLAEWERMLPADSFLRISNSCLVNCRWIHKISGSAVILAEERGQLVMSRRNKKTCQEKFDVYLEKMQIYVR